MLPFGSALLSRRSRRHLHQSPDRDGKGSSHVDAAFMGLISSDCVTVNCKLPVRSSYLRSFPPSDQSSRQALVGKACPAFTALRPTRGIPEFINIILLIKFGLNSRAVEQFGIPDKYGTIAGWARSRKMPVKDPEPKGAI